MGEHRRIDEATLLWVAAVAVDEEPTALLATVDVAGLARIVAEVEATRDPVMAAAALLVGVIGDRPFPASNAAIGWLAATNLLAEAGYRVVARPKQVAQLCRRIRAEALVADRVASALRGWLIPEGLGCPACGRRVYASDAIARRMVTPAGAPFVLTARCAFEHGAHDREGRPVTPAPVRTWEPRQPLLARGPCGSLLVVAPDRTMVVSPYCDDPPIAKVSQVDHLSPGDLIGPWDSLLERSTPIGYVPADAVHVDEHDRVDLARLGRALQQHPTVRDHDATGRSSWRTAAGVS